MRIFYAANLDVHTSKAIRTKSRELGQSEQSRKDGISASLQPAEKKSFLDSPFTLKIILIAKSLSQNPAQYYVHACPVFCA
jgi:hypothetical protein